MAAMFKVLLLAALIGTVMAATARSRAKMKKDREAAWLAAQPMVSVPICSCPSTAFGR